MVATDNGVPENRNGTALVTVTVFSADNFFSPVLDQTSYEAEIAEGSGPGTVVFQFQIEDGDRVGPAAELGNVFLIGGDAEFFNFSITGPTTGEILTAAT